MEQREDAVGAACLCIKRLSLMVNLNNSETKDFNRAWIIIYSYCDTLMRRISWRRSRYREDPFYGIGDLVSEAVLRFQRGIDRTEVMRAPRAYLNRICVRVWLRAEDSIIRRQTRDVEYVEEPDYDSESQSDNWYQKISETIASIESIPMDVRGMLADCLRRKKISMTELKVVLGYYRDEKTLQELAAFYRVSVARIFRLKQGAILSLRNYS